MFTLAFFVKVILVIKFVKSQTQVNKVFGLESYGNHTKGLLGELPACCAQAYNAKRFFLSSPGFPSSDKENDCIYNIYRANSNICRLRLNFNFFWLPDYKANYGCLNEFLEIDGKYICGCHTELKLISPFDSRWEKAPKRIRFKRQSSQNRFNGFVVEIIQDDCPKRIGPIEHFSKTDQNSLQNETKIRFERNVQDNNNAKVYKHFYFFASPSDENLIRLGKKTRDIEQTLYIDTFTIKSALAGTSDHQKCQNWGTSQWETLFNDLAFQQTPACNDFKSRTVNRQYVIANQILGYIQSPRYPYSYPGNLNLAYRIVKQPNYCAVRVHFEEFSLENSFNCNKDSIILLQKHKYCGRRLYKATVTFDLRNKRYEDILFNTKENSCRRGFRAVYQQLPCFNIPSTVRPTYPIIQPTTPCPPPRTTPSLTSCGRNILDNNFLIEVSALNQPRCIFSIFKNNHGVCRLSLTLENSNLICGIERLIIDNQAICGQLAEKTFEVNFNRNQLSLIYERATENPGVTGLRFRLTGIQMTDGCDPYEYPKVPAQRMLFTPNDQYNYNLNTLSTEKGICGIIVNNTSNMDVVSACNKLNQSGSSKKCISVHQSNVLFVPKDFAISGLYMNLINSFNKTTIDKRAMYEILCQDIKELGINL